MAMPKDPAIDVKRSWTNQNLLAAGFWVDDRVAIGSGKELANLAKSVNAKYGVTGKSSGHSAHYWSVTALPGRLRFPRGVHLLDSHPFQPPRRVHHYGAPRAWFPPLSSRMPHLEGRYGDSPMYSARRSTCLAFSRQSAGHRILHQLARPRRTQPRPRLLGSSQTSPPLSQGD